MSDLEYPIPATRSLKFEFKFKFKFEFELELTPWAPSLPIPQTMSLSRLTSASSTDDTPIEVYSLKSSVTVNCASLRCRLVRIIPHSLATQRPSSDTSETTPSLCRPVASAAYSSEHCLIERVSHNPPLHTSSYQTLWSLLFEAEY